MSQFDLVVVSFSVITLFYLSLEKWLPLMKNRSWTVRASVAAMYATILALWMGLYWFGWVEKTAQQVCMGYFLFSLLFVYGKLDRYLIAPPRVIFHQILSFNTYWLFGDRIPYLGIIDLPELFRGVLMLKWGKCPPDFVKLYDTFFFIICRVIYPIHLSFVSTGYIEFIFLTLIWINQFSMTISSAF